MTTQPFRIPNLFDDIVQGGALGSSPFTVTDGQIGSITPTQLGLQSNPFRLQDLEGTEIGQRTIFEQARPDFLQTGRQRDIFSSMFDRVLKDFVGELGTQFRVGQTPQRSFTEFVNAQDFDRQVKREGIGRGVGALVNPARFLFER